MPRGREQIATKEEEHLVLEQFRQGTSAAQIALTMSWPRHRVYALLRRNGISPATLAKRVQKGHLEARADEIVRLYQTPMHTKHVAKVVGASYAGIRRILAQRGVLRDEGQNRQFSDADLRELVRLWDDGKSQGFIAQQFHCSQSVISRVLGRLGKQKETRLQRREKHGAWKGGRTMRAGYVSILLPRDHPFYEALADARGYCLEHRLVMSEKLGRPLAKSETVHHINNVKDDNRPENLQLRQGNHGKHSAWVCLDCGSHNIAAERLAN